MPTIHLHILLLLGQPWASFVVFSESLLRTESARPGKLPAGQGRGSHGRLQHTEGAQPPPSPGLAAQSPSPNGLGQPRLCLHHRSVCSLLHRDLVSNSFLKSTAAQGAHACPATRPSSRNNSAFNLCGSFLVSFQACSPQFLPEPHGSRFQHREIQQALDYL